MTLRISSMLELPDAVRRLNEAQQKPQERPKYGNVVTEEGGETFHSKWELQRWRELQAMEAAGLITNLARQVPFGLHVTNHIGSIERIGAFIADATYYRNSTVLVVEDAKSAATKKDKLYVWKKKHFEIEYGLSITEVERAKRRSKAGGITQECPT